MNGSQLLLKKLKISRKNEREKNGRELKRSYEALLKSQKE